ncbi:serpin family protein [Salininema proteolyticum]|uniref:Serpin family protein n=1 Tax=Salininema proteolyticum TaxID=1607685 RepID=A0ABV8U5Y9_9ACTN
MVSKLLAADIVAAANSLTAHWTDSLPRPPKVVSGLGLWPLLAELALGAGTDTRAELVEALGKDPSPGDVAAVASLLASSPDARCALGTWAGPRIALDPEWVDSLPEGTLGSLTGDPRADQDRLDAWAAEQTRGLIEEIPLDMSQKPDLVLASALTVLLEWRQAFTPRPTLIDSGPWTSPEPWQGLTLTAGAADLRYTDGLTKWTARGKEDVDVVLAIGSPEVSDQYVLSETVRTAADADWGSPAAGLAVGDSGPGFTVEEAPGPAPGEDGEAAVSTVAFDLKERLDLLEDADVLGLRTASDRDRADFSRLSAAPGCYVGQAKQDSVATFSATGFEAASVTAVGMLRMAAVAPPKGTHARVELAFDRPFAYAAVHRPSGAVLLAGWVDSPQRAR